MPNYKDRLKSQPSANGDGFEAAMSAAYSDGTFEKARTQDHSSGGFEVPELEDGTYYARLIRAKADCKEKTDRGGKKFQQPFVVFGFKIVTGEDEGKSPSSWFNLGGQTAEQREKRLNVVLGQFQSLGMDTTEFDFSAILKACQDLSDPSSDIGRPLVEINVRNSTSADGRKWQTSYVRKVVTAAQIGLEDDYEEPSK